MTANVPYKPAMKSITHIKSSFTDGDKEILRVSPVRIRVLEDGSNTDMRLGAVSVTLPPHTRGPPQHWHEMHDETFLVTSGTVRFLTGDDRLDVQTGDYVVVPPQAPHTFENATDENAGPL